MYKNSSQALGYGLVVDRIAHDMGLSNNYNVLYPVYLTRSQEWRNFLFQKSDVQRARWLQQILLDVGIIQQYSEIECFPMYGEACFSFGRQCKFFGLCGLSNKSLHLESPGIRLDRNGEYPFKFSIDELIEAQQAKV